MTILILCITLLDKIYNEEKVEKAKEVSILFQSTINYGPTSKYSTTHLTNLLSKHDALAHTDFFFYEILSQTPQRDVFHYKLDLLSSCKCTMRQCFYLSILLHSKWWSELMLSRLSAQSLKYCHSIKPVVRLVWIFNYWIQVIIKKQLNWNYWADSTSTGGLTHIFKVDRWLPRAHQHQCISPCTSQCWRDRETLGFQSPSSSPDQHLHSLVSKILLQRTLLSHRWRGRTGTEWLFQSVPTDGEMRMIAFLAHRNSKVWCWNSPPPSLSSSSGSAFGTRWGPMVAARSREICRDLCG